MIRLEQQKPFPKNQEWPYLYAIAEIYQKYSFDKYSKEYDLYAPHPLKDTEVIQILDEKYGLKVHRNTISNYRLKLCEYFGFEFKIYKKGKYLVCRQAENDKMFLKIAIALTTLKTFSGNEIREMLTFLSKFAYSDSIQSLITNGLKINASSKRNIINEDIMANIQKIATAMHMNSNISFIYGNKKEKCNPGRIYLDDCNVFRLLCYNQNYMISGIKDIKGKYIK